MVVEDQTAKNPEVLNKYQAASDIANRALKHAIALSQPGTKLSTICRGTDTQIQEMAGKVYAKQKGLLKGIAFPTAVSVNNLLCHVSPVEGDQNDRALETGDLVKIELGAHIDGYPALVCHSLVVGEASSVTGRKADLLQAAHLASEAAIRLLREGKSSTDIRLAVQSICKDHSVSPIEGMMSHGLGKDNLAVQDLTIVVSPTEIQTRSIQETQFKPYQVWCIDVADHRTSIWSKNPDVPPYSLKLKGSRAVFSEIQSKFGCMAFHQALLDDPVKARMALNECATHQLVQPYEVQGEKGGEDLTARFMFTAVIMPAGPLKLTGPAFDLASVKSEVVISDPALKALLDAPIRPKKQ